MPTIAIYAVIALAALGAFGGFVAYERKAGADKVRAELQPKLTACEGTVAQAKVLGEAAQKKAAETKAADEKRKKDADNENTAAVARLNADIAKLRANPNRSRGGSVPPAPAGSKCPDGQTCFDRAEYQRTVGDFDTGTRRLADEGSAVTTDMNTALKWAQSLGAPPH